MHEPIMIGPTADAVRARLSNSLNSRSPQLSVRFSSKKTPAIFSSSTRAGEELIRDLHQKLEIVLPQNFFPAAPYRSPQGGRIPAMRFDFVFEEPLNAGRMLG